MKKILRKFFDNLKLVFSKIKNFFVFIFKKIDSGIKKIFRTKKSKRIFVGFVLSFLSISLILSFFPLQTDRNSKGKVNSSIGLPVTYVDQFQYLFAQTKNVGDEITVSKKTASDVTFVMADFNKSTIQNKTNAETIELVSKNIIQGMSFSMPQLLYCAKSGLPAGRYKFSLKNATYGGASSYDGTYMFTLTKPVPAYGGFRHDNIGLVKTSYNIGDVLGLHLITYSPVNENGVGGNIIETVGVSIYDNSLTCVDLGTFTAIDRSLMTDDGYHNSTERNAYGSNRYRDSIIRQWLNSSAGSNFWRPQSIFDLVPSCSYMAGFLYGLDQEFINSLGVTEIKTVLSQFDIIDGNLVDVTYDKVYLLSLKNVFGVDEISSVIESIQFRFFYNSTPSKIKNSFNISNFWWLRTPYSCQSLHAYDVFNTHIQHLYNVDVVGGVVPACTLVKKI